MKKALLIVAMLLAVSPVIAGVTITAVPEGTYIASDGNRAATIRIVYSSDVNVRAFGLDITVDNGCNFWNIRDFNVGESNYPNQPVGYGIFPGRFRQFINASNPNWSDGNYSPLPPYNDPGSANTGIGWGTIIAEMGYLGAQTMVGGVDVNMPAKVGTLFRIDVNGYGKTDANLTISLDTLRGGVIDANTTSAAATNLPVTSKVVFGSPCTTPTPEVGNLKATAEGVWTGQGFTLCGSPTTSCPAGVILTQESGCYTLPHCIVYTYSVAPTVPNVVSPAKILGDANTAIINAGLSVGTITYTCSNTVAKNYVISSNPVAGTSTCSAVAMLVSTGPCDCFPSSDPAYNDWVSFGKPACWCNGRQCHGDADGLTQGSAKAGYYYVGTNDLAVLTAAWLVLEPTKGPGIATISVNGIPGICADFAHDQQGSAKAGYYRVGTNDLNRMLTYWLVLEPTKGPGTPADCPHN